MNSVRTETRRLAARQRTGLLDAPPPSAIFDGLTTLATRLPGVPVALVSLVDADRGSTFDVAIPGRA